MDFHRFARWFRDSSPYIREHRGKVFVILMPDASLQHDRIENIVKDLALLHVLGVKQVLILETPMDERASRIEAMKKLFARGLPSSRYRNQAIPVIEETYASSTASHQNQGSESSHDQQQKHINRLAQILDEGSIALVAPTIDEAIRNRSYDTTVDDSAAAVAQALGADKLIVFHEPASLVHDANVVNSDLSTDAFQDIIEHQDLGEATAYRMRALLHACRQGVNRGHIVSYENDGALLAELFTADGSGTQISTDDYLTIRRATDTDTDAIFDLMQTDIEEDRLVPRTRDLLSSDLTTIFLAEHDNVPVGCVALYSLSQGMQEIGTLLAAPKHRDRNIGSRLLGRAETEARKRGASHVYVFTKHAVDWFTRHDYLPASLDSLPVDALATYDHGRQSTLLIKELA
ncbi:MAG: GNAT family N-acetyltransferase [Pseudomonadales bacterium]|nr:GNAT family N-acetyltransferase [Pseudomonadales bacterium]